MSESTREVTLRRCVALVYEKLAFAPLLSFPSRLLLIMMVTTGISLCSSAKGHRKGMKQGIEGSSWGFEIEIGRAHV